MSLNKIHIIGRVGKDPESITTKSGDVMTKFSVAVSDKYNGEERTQWFNCKAFKYSATYILNNVQKGTQVYIEGSMQSNKYEDKTYWDLITSKVLVLDGRKAQDDSGKGY